MPKFANDQTKSISAIDALFTMADGETLPGTLGLIQKLLNVWTAGWPMPGASNFQWAGWTMKNVLQSASLVKKFQQEQDIYKIRQKYDIVKDFMGARDLVYPEGSMGLGLLIYAYACHLPFVDETLGEEEYLIRWFTTPDGTQFCYIFYDGKSCPGVQEVAALPPGTLGPLAASKDACNVMQSINHLVWTHKEKEDLELSLINSEDPSEGISLKGIGVPSVFLNVNQKEPWSDVVALANRYALFQAKGYTRRVLFHGPAGCGKSSLCRTLARAITDGQTLRLGPQAMMFIDLTYLLRIIELLKPKVLLLDDIDRCGEYSSRLLHALEDFATNTWAKDIIVVGTANVTEVIDPALMRAGRFDEIYYVGFPDEEHRLQLIKHFSQAHGLDCDSSLLCRRTEGWAPAELRELVKRLSVLGMEFLDIEVASIDMHRQLYAGDKMHNFLAKQLSMNSLAAKGPVPDVNLDL